VHFFSKTEAKICVLILKNIFVMGGRAQDAYSTFFSIFILVWRDFSDFS